jgi:hypothetical protein
MHSKRFLSHVGSFAERYLLLAGFIIFGVVASAQTIPGTLGDSCTGTTTTHAPLCTVHTTTCIDYVFTDAQQVKHPFTGAKSVFQYWTGSSNQCAKGPFYTTFNSWSDDNSYFANGTFTYPLHNLKETVIGVHGTMYPKYVILNVVYAPPGSHSSIDYSNSTLVGSSATYTSSFMDMSQQSYSVGLTSGTIFGIFGNEPDISVTGTRTNSFTQETDSTSSITVNKKTSFDNIIGGPSSDFVGVDHTQDQVYIWLNPTLLFAVYDNSAAVQFGGYSFDLNDPVSVDGNLDIVHLSVAELQNPSLIDPATKTSLARTWAQKLSDGSSPGLTNADLLEIAKADPFSNSSYKPVFTAASAPCSTDGRFCDVTSVGQPIQYMQNPGGSPSMQKFSQGYQKIATQGQGFKDTHSVGYSLDVMLKNGFLGIFNLDFKASTTLTWVNGYSSTSTNTTGQTASVSVTGPSCTGNPCNPVYKGPTLFNTYEDTVYRTFMFFGAN